MSLSIENDWMQGWDSRGITYEICTTHWLGFRPRRLLWSHTPINMHTENRCAKRMKLNIVCSKLYDLPSKMQMNNYSKYVALIFRPKDLHENAKHKSLCHLCCYVYFIFYACFKICCIDISTTDLHQNTKASKVLLLYSEDVLVQISIQHVSKLNSFSISWKWHKTLSELHRSSSPKVQIILRI